MTSTPIYTALNVPTVTAYPSITCLQWSPDGQAYLTTKSAVYIMTPDHGINFDSSSAIKSVPPKQETDERHTLSWFRTAVQTSTSIIEYHWPDHSQAWGAVSLGSIDVDLVASAVSPCDVSSGAGCVLAILSSNMDLTLWTAGKNGLKGEWNKSFDVVPFLLKTFDQNDLESKTQRILKAQITSMSWSPQADFGVVPTPNINGSLLVLGNRAGTLLFLRYQRDSTVDLVHIEQVANGWVTHVSVSSWKVIESGVCEAFVAFGMEDGRLKVVKIRQSLNRGGDNVSLYGLQRTIIFQYNPEEDVRLVIPAELRTFNGLSWITLSDGRRILLSFKPGFVYLWSDVSQTSAWSGLVTLSVQSLRLSVGASSRHPVSGIQYLRERDSLVLTTFDGCFHVIQNLSTSPTWSTGETTLNSIQLSTQVRSLCSRVESRTMQFSDVTRISGAMSYDGHNTLLWAHEVSRPSEFAYKHEAKMNTKLVVADVGDEPDMSTIQEDLRDVLVNCSAASGSSPLHLLRPSLLNIRRSKHIQELHPQLLQILQTPFDDHSVLINIPKTEQPLSPEGRTDFRESIRTHLFGWNILLSLRMRLLLADYLWNSSPGEASQSKCGGIAQSLLTAISHMNLRTLIRHLVASASMLEQQDVPFVLRLVIQSMLPGTPSDLSAEGQQLTGIVQSLTGVEPQVFMTGEALKETCPACHAEVPLTDITKATCANGHSWERCSITTFLLATSHVRTCIGCTRKAFLPFSSFKSPETTAPLNWLPDIGRGWVVQELLEGVNRCLFCGNSFVSVL